METKVKEGEPGRSQEQVEPDIDPESRQEEDQQWNWWREESW